MESCCTRFTAAEGGTRLAITAAEKNTLATEYSAFITTRLIYEEAHKIRGSLFDGYQRSIYVTRPSRVKCTAYELSILTDLKVIEALEFTDVYDWCAELDRKEVVVCTSQVLKQILDDEVLKISNLNVLVLDSCHLVFKDENLRFIMQQYKSCPEDNRPRILGLTYPLFTSPNKPLNDQASTQTTDKSKDQSEEDTELDSEEDNQPRIQKEAVEQTTPSDTIAKEKQPNVSTTELNSNKTDTQLEDKVSIPTKDDSIPTKDDSIPTKDDSIPTKVDSSPTEDDSSPSTDNSSPDTETQELTSTLENLKLNSRNEFGAYENLDDFQMYEKLEWKIDEMEKELCCEMDLAEDIDGGKRIASSVSKPKEVIIEFTPHEDRQELSEDYKSLEKFMRDTVREAEEFINEHRYDPTEIYGEELYEEFKNIPDPTIEPKIIFKQFIYILDQLGPYGADKAAFSMLSKIEKLKIKVPYERHFLLLCLCTTVFVKIRCYADLILSKYTDDWEKIKQFCTPKVHRFAEILEQFQPPVSDKIEEASSPKDETSSQIDATEKNEKSDEIDHVDVKTNDEDKTVDIEKESEKSTKETTTTTEMLDAIENCDFKTLSNKIEDKVNTITGNLKEIDDDSFSDDLLERRIIEITDETKLPKDFFKKTPIVDDLDTQTNDNATNEEVSSVIEPENPLEVENKDPKIDVNTFPDVKFEAKFPDAQKFGFKRMGFRVRGRGRSPRGNLSRNQQNSQNADGLCAVVFMKEPLMAKILFLLIVDMSRWNPRMSCICAQFCSSGVSESASEAKRREEVLKKFRMHECNLLLATSALEEGIDLPRCNLVMRWDMPQSYRSYSLGRARARANRAVSAICGSSTNTETMVDTLSLYTQLDQIITNKCGCGIQDEPPLSEEVHADAFSTIINAYSPVDNVNNKKNQQNDASKSDCKENDEIVDENNADKSNVEATKENDENNDEISNKEEKIQETKTKNSDPKEKANKELNNDLEKKIPEKDDVNANCNKCYVSTDCHCLLTVPKEISDKVNSESVDCSKAESSVEGVASVDLNSAIALINRYCGKLPSDTFTRLAPYWKTEKVRLPTKCDGSLRDAYICTLRLPLNAPVKYNIVGHPMPTRVLARRMVALQACRILHKSGELDDQLMPIGKENFRAPTESHKAGDFTFLEEEEVEAEENGDNPRPGTTKRRQYYYKRSIEAMDSVDRRARKNINNFDLTAKKLQSLDLRRKVACLAVYYRLHFGECANALFDQTASAFTDCEPIIDSTDAEIYPELAGKEGEEEVSEAAKNGTKRNMLYAIVSTLWCALPERYNTRGRRLHSPQNANQAVAILMSSEHANSFSLQIPWFPVYTRSGEVRVSIQHVEDADVRLCPRRGRLVRRFMRFVFAEVLRVRRCGMKLDTKGMTHNNYYIVPTCKSLREDGSTKVDIDWSFLELIYVHTNDKKRSILEKPILWHLDDEEQDDMDQLTQDNQTADSKDHQNLDEENPEMDSKSLIEAIKSDKLEPDKDGDKKEKRVANPLLKSGEIFAFDAEKYKEAVVTPWYRNQDQPQFFLVAEICWHLRPDSAFSSAAHATFREYYAAKYGATLTQRDQPLLDVDHTSARLNLLTPRYVNRKGVALPVSSERTRRAKRDRLDQKQILVPELCRVHPFAAPLWFATVALPCVLYRVNALLIADEIRRAVAIDVGLGVPRIDEKTCPGFQWPPLDFGWSLAEVLNAEEKTDGKNEDEDQSKKENVDEATEDTEEIKEDSREDSSTEENKTEDQDPQKEKTINDILAEKEDNENGFEIGTWSNEMASSIPQNEYDEMMEPLPSNLTFCTSASGGTNWCDPIEKPKNEFNPSRTFSVADSDCSLMSSDFDTDTDLNSEDSEEDTETSGLTSSHAAMGVRIEYKTPHEAEAVEVECKKTNNAPLPDEQDDEQDRKICAEFIRSGEAPKEYIDKFKNAIGEHKKVIIENSLIKAEEPINNLLPFTSHTSHFILPCKGTDNLETESKTNGLETVTENVNKQDVKPDEEIEKLAKDLSETLTKTSNQTDDKNVTTKTDKEIEEIANELSKVDFKVDDKNRVTIDEIFPYKTDLLSTKDEKVTLESIERNKRLLLNGLKTSLSKEEIKKLHCFSMKDVDIDSPDYVNEKSSTVGFDTEESYTQKLGNQKSEEFKPFYLDGKDPSGEFDFDYQPDLQGHPGPSPSVILQALTMSNANDGINLERLETVGDSFLKLAITTYLYCGQTRVHEGKLSHMRSKQVSNLNLYRLGRNKRLGARMIASKFEPHDNWLPPCHTAPPALSNDLHDPSMAKHDPNNTTGCFIPYNLITQHSIPDKSIADCVEALIGAYLLRCGCRGALLFMCWLGIKVLPLLLLPLPASMKPPPTFQKPCKLDSNLDSLTPEEESWLKTRPVGSLRPVKNDKGEWILPVFGELKAPPSPLLRYVENPEGELEKMLSGYDELERTLQYRFNDRSLLLQAMTHASHHKNTLTDCYQRLEFLGDAILDYLITRHLYEDSRRHSPGALTDLRSALVNNTIFATLAVRHGFHKYFRHMSSGLNEVLTKYVKIQEENGHSISEEHYLIQEDEMEQAEDVEVPKALGDLFESVAGAIFLDSGMSLGAVWKSYVQLMGAELEAFSAAAPKSPVRELLEAEPDTAKFGKPERLADGRRVRVCVEVFGRGTFKGIGRNYRIAKGTAARCALRHLRGAKN